MWQRIARWPVFVMTACTAATTCAAPPMESFDLRVPAAPMPRAMDGGQQLVYELHLHNYARRDLQPVRVDVLKAENGTVLATYEGAALEQRLDRSGMQWNAEAFHSIPSGRRGVVFVELLMMGDVPDALTHRVAFVAPGDAENVQRIEGGHAAVVKGKTPVLAPPLAGGPWVSIHDPRWARGHRRVGHAFDGAVRTPGRYAADWVKLDARGHKAPPGNTLASRTYSHGQSVHAVADGVVIGVHDLAPERVRLSDSAPSLEGNSLVLKLDSGHYAHYGHLRPGSARVVQGARVKRGQKIAEVGFSGSASDPQLHFALTDGPDERSSEGVAYTFQRHRLLGRYADVADIGRMPWTPEASARDDVRASMPAGMSVVAWPN